MVLITLIQTQKMHKIEEMSISTYSYVFFNI